jgi:hypothetical protein
MSDQLERELRGALHRISTAAPPPNLTQAALRQAGRASLVRRVSAGAAAVAVAGVTAAAAAVTGGVHSGGAPGPGSSAGSHSPAAPSFAGKQVVAAYSCTSGTQGVTRSLVLNRATGRYVTTPYCDVALSPDGARAMVTDYNNGHPRYGILDVAANHVRWLAGGYATTGSGGEWAPDGRHLLLTGGRTDIGQEAELRPENNGFMIVDTATLRIDFHPVLDVPNTLGAHGVWLPDGQTIAITVGTAGTGEGGPRVTGIRLYDQRGQALRTLPATRGLLAGGAISPDGGTMVLLNPVGIDPDPQLADTRTGRVLRTVRLPAGTAIMGWYDADHLILLADVTGRHASHPLLITDLSGHPLRTVPTGPANHPGISDDLVLAPAAGLPPAASGIVF